MSVIAGTAEHSDVVDKSDACLATLCFIQSIYSGA